MRGRGADGRRCARGATQTDGVANLDGRGGGVGCARRPDPAVAGLIERVARMAIWNSSATRLLGVGALGAGLTTAGADRTRDGVGLRRHRRRPVGHRDPGTQSVRSAPEGRGDQAPLRPKMLRKSRIRSSRRTLSRPPTPEPNAGSNRGRPGAECGSRTNADPEPTAADKADTGRTAQRPRLPRRKRGRSPRPLPRRISRPMPRPPKSPSPWHHPSRRALPPPRPPRRCWRCRRWRARTPGRTGAGPPAPRS